MADELSEVLSKFSLLATETENTELDLNDVLSSENECRKSLIGKVVGEKVVNYTGMKNFVTQAWGFPKKILVTQLGNNKFQFNLDNAAERERIVEGGPWIIDGQILVLKRWRRGIEDEEGVFLDAKIWVQVWNLPLHWMSKGVGRKIGAVFKEVHDVMIPQTGSKEGKHMKMLVTMDLDQPLLRGTKVSAEGVTRWLHFKYERCPDFCFKCGRVGHSYKSCIENYSGDEGMNGNQYGNWLKAMALRLVGEGEGSRGQLHSSEQRAEGRNSYTQQSEKSRGDKVSQPEIRDSNGERDEVVELVKEPGNAENHLIRKEKLKEKRTLPQSIVGRETANNKGNMIRREEPFNSSVDTAKVVNSKPAKDKDETEGMEVIRREDTKGKMQREQGNQERAGIAETARIMEEEAVSGQQKLNMANTQCSQNQEMELDSKIDNSLGSTNQIKTTRGFKRRKPTLRDITNKLKKEKELGKRKLSELQLTGVEQEDERKENQRRRMEEDQTNDRMVEKVEGANLIRPPRLS